MPGWLRWFARASYVVSAVILVGGYALWQWACVPPTDAELVERLTRHRADFEALRDLALEDYNASGMYVMWKDLRFSRDGDARRIAGRRTGNELPAARARRYKDLFASTGTRLIKIHDGGAIEFEMWMIGAPPDVWH